MNKLISQLDKKRIPSHIAMIMDGNGRWAKEKGENRIFGHFKGVDTVKRMVEICSEIGVKYLTLYAFSTENWNRPKEEVDALMELLVSSLKNELPALNENNVVLDTIGNLEDLPKKCQLELAEAKAQTSKNNGLKLVLALSYSAKWDILNATKKLIDRVAAGDLKSTDIDSTCFEQNLTTRELPAPELMIRTSGECRISNFLLWEMAYTELIFSPVFWPDYQKSDLINAILDYQQRERRFGKTSEQMNHDLF